MANPVNRGITKRGDIDHKGDIGGADDGALPGDAMGNSSRNAGAAIFLDAINGKLDSNNSIGNPEGWDGYSSKKGQPGTY